MSINNSNSSKHKIKISQEKKTTWEFRDPKTPNRICHLLGKEISATDLKLLWIIDGLVKGHGPEAGMGCFASNRRLADYLEVNSNYVSGRLAHLQSLGLLLIIYWKGNRYLEAEWSRTAEERSELTGGYGDANRKAHNQLLKRLKYKKDSSGDSDKHVSPPSGKPVPPLQENLNHKYNDKDYSKKNERRPSQPDDSTIPPNSFTGKANQPHLNGTGKNSRPEGKEPFPDPSEGKESPARILAVKLYQFLSDKNKILRPVKDGLRSWTKSFNGLLEFKSPEEIDRVLDGYFKIFGKQYTPVAFSADAFCSKFNEIEDAINRGKSEQRINPFTGKPDHQSEAYRKKYGYWHD